MLRESKQALISPSTAMGIRKRRFLSISLAPRIIISRSPISVQTYLRSWKTPLTALTVKTATSTSICMKNTCPPQAEIFSSARRKMIGSLPAAQSGWAMWTIICPSATMTMLRISSTAHLMIFWNIPPALSRTRSLNLNRSRSQTCRKLSTL